MIVVVVGAQLIVGAHVPLKVGPLALHLVAHEKEEPDVAPEAPDVPPQNFHATPDKVRKLHYKLKFEGFRINVCTYIYILQRYATKGYGRYATQSVRYAHTHTTCAGLSRVLSVRQCDGISA